MKLIVDYFRKMTYAIKAAGRKSAENRLVSDIQGRNIFC